MGNEGRIYQHPHYELIEGADGSKSLVIITTKVRKYVHLRMEGKPKTTALRLSKTSAREIQEATDDGTIPAYLRERLREVGADERRISQVIAEAMSAEKYVSITTEEVNGDSRTKKTVSKIVPDHGMRHTAARTAAELLGYTGKKEEKKEGDKIVNFINHTEMHTTDPGKILADMVARANAVKRNEVYKPDSIDADFEEEAAIDRQEQDGGQED